MIHLKTLPVANSAWCIVGFSMKHSFTKCRIPIGLYSAVQCACTMTFRSHIGLPLDGNLKCLFWCTRNLTQTEICERKSLMMYLYLHRDYDAQNFRIIYISSLSTTTLRIFKKFHDMLRYTSRALTWNSLSLFIYLLWDWRSGPLYDQ